MEPRVAKRISHFLKRSGLSRREFAKATGVTRSAVSQWVNDDVEPPQERIALIIKAFGIDLATFYGPLVDDEDAKESGTEDDDGGDADGSSTAAAVVA